MAIALAEAGADILLVQVDNLHSVNQTHTDQFPHSATNQTNPQDKKSKNSAAKPKSTQPTSHPATLYLPWSKK